jgi:hypothetical protein
VFGLLNEGIGGDVSTAEIYATLQQVCRELEGAGDHAIAAMVSHSMAMIQAKYGVATDHLDKPESDD